MKKSIFTYIIITLIVGACSTEHNYQVSAHLTPQEQDEMLWKIIRYVGRSPEGLTFDERFYAPYDSFYREQAKLHRFDAYYKEGNTHYFLVSRRAPSLGDKRVATGGKFTFSDKDRIVEYEEVFRTWKMVPDTLAKREMVIFDKFVKGESLSPYETRNSKGIEYIEFPDERTYFDKESRQWKTK
ncbi:MAG TPA: hypothetical protein DHV26_13295 [Cytophagales bacterium]|nr:hypothetical protein [Cytophagales bacterium]HRG08340.1 hypothetical protein [Cyclobacteriaceae bacterium]